MADFVIRGMEMPESNFQFINLQVWGNGDVYKMDKQGNLIPTKLHAVPLPEGHGRLIDADALNDVLIKLADNKYSPKVFASWLSYEENAPTIVPAEGGGE